jgi:hypothetical protein
MNPQEPVIGSATSSGLDMLRAYYLHNPKRLYFQGICMALITLFLSIAVINKPDIVYMLTFWLIFLFPALALTIPLSLVVLSCMHSKEQKQLRYQIDSEKIVIQSTSGTLISLAWKDVRIAHQYRSGVAIGLKPAGGLWLPKRAFTSEGMNTLTRLITQKKDI